MSQENLYDSFKDSDDYYDFLKNNFPKTSNLLFEQYLLKEEAAFRDYLVNFLCQKRNEPLYSLDLYMQGKKDLCIQFIDLNDMDKDFATDMECYSFLTTYMYSQEQVKKGKEFLKFVENQIEILNLRFTDKTLATNQDDFTEFQKQLTIFANEL